MEMEKYYVLFNTNLKLEHEKPKPSNVKVFSKTKKEKKKGYAFLVGFYKNRNELIKVLNSLGIFNWNTTTSINNEEEWDREIEADILKDFIVIDTLNAKKINDKIRKQWENSAEGKKFKKDWSFLSSN